MPVIVLHYFQDQQNSLIVQTAIPFSDLINLFHRPWRFRFLVLVLVSLPRLLCIASPLLLLSDYKQSVHISSPFQR